MSNHFDAAIPAASLPSKDTPSSIFDLSHSHYTTINVGELTPIDCQFLYPGDTFKQNSKSIMRMTTPGVPVMSDAELDVYTFFVPCRLLQDHWRNIFGENTAGSWTQTTEYEAAKIISNSSTGFPVGGAADHLGYPTNVPNVTANALPLRAYCLIRDEWFRNQALQKPSSWSKGDSLTTGVSDLSGLPENNAVKGGVLFKCTRIRDYFSTCLPTPQKHDPVPLASGVLAPVTAGAAITGRITNHLKWGMLNDTAANTPWYLYEDANTVWAQPDSGTPTYSVLTPKNLWADLGTAGLDINKVRQSFMLQSLYERDAMFGTRYVEYINAAFGVSTDDARLQRPEYVGGKHVTLNVQQVVQTSGTTVDSPIGHTGAYSFTYSDDSENVFYSAREHGYLMTLAVVRYRHSYSQGIRRDLLRTKRTDFYDPVFARLGNQPVYTAELYAHSSNAQTRDYLESHIFGYQEAWADLRYCEDQVSGFARPIGSNDYSNWLYAEKYTATPTLSQSWIEESRGIFDKTLLVTDGSVPDFLAQFYFEVEATRPLPMFSIPATL